MYYRNLVYRSTFRIFLFVLQYYTEYTIICVSFLERAEAFAPISGLFLLSFCLLSACPSGSYCWALVLSAEVSVVASRSFIATIVFSFGVGVLDSDVCSFSGTLQDYPPHQTHLPQQSYHPTWWNHVWLEASRSPRCPALCDSIYSIILFRITLA